jgi:SulP family sulfate permease
VLVLRMREVHAVDASGLQTLDELRERTRRQKTALVLSGVHSQPLEAMERSGLADRLGRENIVPNIDLALARARRILDDATPRETAAPHG